MKKYNSYIILVIFLIPFILYILLQFSDSTESYNNIDNVTVVSGYWNVKNKHLNNYNDWFKNTLKINQKYVFFCDETDNDNISSYRNGYETNFINYPLSSFYSRKYLKDEYISHPIHVPSKELGLIWNEKVHLIKLAKDFDHSPSEYYIWIDAGIAPYRNTEPPQVRLNINSELFPPNKLYYSHVDEDYHNFSGGVLIFHKDIIDEFHDKYYQTLYDCNDEWKCGSEQYIFTKMLKLYPEMFYKISDGYGENLVALYNCLLQ